MTHKMLCKVCDIDWTDAGINRAGVIPLFDDGKRQWIGLGVSNYNTNITTLGGSYSTSDHDLLSTAVREYNEEVGSNMPHLTEEAVYNHYAIVTEYDINILFPIEARPVDFEKTEEVYTMIWITPRQLMCMSSCHNFYKSKTKIISMALGLVYLISILAQTVDSLVPFEHTSEQRPFIRPLRRVTMMSRKVFTNIQDYERDARDWWRINRNTSCVVLENKIGLLYGENFYLLPISEIQTVDDISYSYNIDVVTSTINQGSNIFRRCKSIESISSGDEYLNVIFEEFMDERKRIESRTVAGKIISELRLIADYEWKIYKLVEKLGLYFVPRKAKFLVAVENVNRQLSEGSLRAAEVINSLVNKCNYEKSESIYMIEMMTRIKLVVRPVKPFLIDI